MKNNLIGKTVLITGASSGIGSSCALYLAKMGVNLILCARRKEILQDIKKELAIHNVDITILQIDVSKKDEVEEKLSKILKTINIDILINSAGLALGLEEFDKADLDDWDNMIDTNIKGLLYVSHKIIPQMREKNSGHIINLGSIAGVMTYPKGNVYCATKHSVHSISEAMNVDLADTNIRVSNIAPGAVETEFSNVRFKGDDNKADSVYKGFIPLTPDDIADMIVYVLNVPAHINIQNTLIMPTAQRNAYITNRG
ncbi:MAG: Unknown protein [uncultured Campylobacterales bacterium]|uniref:NAD(P)-dependent oxidoreductase n=1 Tax=uncultured Campylobacterales bacterium TaxID=352960 RepID=A0A6S6RXY4_9BACT|nr:MAG: Unknown protein [uncultured Campylobacterales bacterium]